MHWPIRKWDRLASLGTHSPLRRQVMLEETTDATMLRIQVSYQASGAKADADAVQCPQQLSLTLAAALESVSLSVRTASACVRVRASLYVASAHSHCVRQLAGAAKAKSLPPFSFESAAPITRPHPRERSVRAATWMVSDPIAVRTVQCASAMRSDALPPTQT